MTRLSKRIVDKAVSTTTRFYVWDDTISGFGLLVLPSGVKSYLLTYRTQEGRQRRLTLGKHGDITPEQARQRASELRELIRNGRDPLGDKEARRDAMTVAQMCDLYTESEAFGTKATATRYNDHGRIRRHLKPLLGKRPADAVTAAEVEKALRDIRGGKTARTEKSDKLRGLARVKGGTSAAIDSIGLLRAIYNWAIARKLVAANPTEGVRLGSHGIREIILESEDDYRRMFAALDQLVAEHRIRPQVADCIAVIAMTGSRKSEIAKCQWRWVDLQRGQIVLPASQHKTGKRTGKPRIIALPTLAQEIVSRQANGSSRPDDLVFSSSRADLPVQLTRPWQLVRETAKLPPNIGLHALRHSLASTMAAAGSDVLQIATTLGHKGVAVAQRYVHYAQGARQAIAERAASTVVAGFEKARGKPSAEVVKIGDARRGK